MTSEPATLPLSLSSLQHDVHTPSTNNNLTHSETASSAGTSRMEANDNAHVNAKNGWNPNVTMADEGETILQEETMVADDDEVDTYEKGDKRESQNLENGANHHATWNARDSQDAPHDSSPGVHTDRQLPDTNEEDIADNWDPLRRNESSHPGDVNQPHDSTLVVGEGDVVDSNGRLLFPDTDAKPSPAVSRRASHLRLDIKPASPQPWDLVGPPSGNNDKTYYSPTESQKFRTLQSTTHTRPLIPKSSYYFGPPPSDSAYGTPPMGQIGVHHPREILRVERDYTGGELIQFAPIYPLELEGRITPTQFLESVNAINEQLIAAHSLHHAFVDNVITIFSLQLSKLFRKTHYEKEMQRLQDLIDDLNAGLYNPVGLNIRWPRDVAFLYLEIEYY